jgi:hypothetical protein
MEVMLEAGAKWGLGKNQIANCFAALTATLATAQNIQGGQLQRVPSKASIKM